MIKIIKINNNKIKIITDEKTLKFISNKFTFRAKNYFWSKAYKDGRWDGKIRYINIRNGNAPIGLLHKILQILIKIKKPYTVDKSILLTNFNNYNIDCLKEISLYDYQTYALNKIIKFKRGIIKAPTGSGKTIMAIGLANYLKQKGLENIIIITPRATIVEQFYERFVIFSNKINPNNIGRLYANYKEIDKPILIATWQSILNVYKQDNYNFFNKFNVLIFDEAHLATAKEVNKLIKSFNQAEYKYAFSATYKENDDIEMHNIYSSFGGFIHKISIEELQQKNRLSDYNIEMHILKNNHDIYYYDDYLDYMINNEKRINYIIDLVNKIKQKNTLIFVRNIALGEKLQNKIKDSYFIHGKIKIEDRIKIKKILENENNKILIATIGAFGIGEDVLNIHNIILTQPRESEIEAIQTIGRGLRKLKNKTLTIYDIADNIPYAIKYAKKRLRTYKEYGLNKIIKRSIQI